MSVHTTQLHVQFSDTSPHLDELRQILADIAARGLVQIFRSTVTRANADDTDVKIVLIVDSVVEVDTEFRGEPNDFFNFVHQLLMTG